MSMKRTLYSISLAILLAFYLGARPVYAAHKNYLDVEAGISAYFQFSGPTNLQSNLLRNLFRTITNESDHYLIGFIPRAGLEQYPTLDTKVFVHNSGWAVAYYLGDDSPSSIIFGTNVSPATQLDDVLSKIADSIEVENYQVHYFNFRHPSARGMLIFQADIAGGSNKTFDFRLPSDNAYYERSWYLYAPGLFSRVTLTIDGKLIYDRINGLSLATIPAEDLITDAKHIVNLSGGLTGGYFGMAILFSGEADFTVNYADSIHIIDLPPIPQGLDLAACDVATTYPLFISALSR
jgi:hypothetical protein